MSLPDYGEGDTPARPWLPGCECGARKVHGFGPGEVGHSPWCPWSPGNVGIPWFCELDGCVNPSAHAFFVELPTLVMWKGVHYFCSHHWGLYQDPRWQHWAVKPRQ